MVLRRQMGKDHGGEWGVSGPSSRRLLGGGRGVARETFSALPCFNPLGRIYFGFRCLNAFVLAVIY